MVVYELMMLLCAFVCALVVTIFVTPLFIKIAFARNILDNPTVLKNHASATPYLGGLAIYTAFIIVLALFFPVYWNLSLFLIGATLLLLVGLIDDLLPLSAFYKFWGQIIAVLCFLKGGFSLKHEFIESFSHIFIPHILAIISFIWMLTVINAINLVDIMDGLASTVALSSLVGFLVFACFYNLYSVALIVVICIGMLLGFLYFNKTPAKIYLGDAGSLFIGGILSIIPFMIPWGTYTVYGLFTPVIILGVPLVEIAALILIRTYKKLPFYLGSPHHFKHYLARKEWSKNGILLLVSGINIVLIVISFLFNLGYLSLLATTVLLLLLLVAWCATIYLNITPYLSKKS